MNDADRYRNAPCPPCKPFYVATRTYVAECPNGVPGGPLAVTRQARSEYSEEHAAVLAMALAKAEAEAEIRCVFTSTKCVQPVCGGYYYGAICKVGESPVSQAAADAAALLAAQAAATAFCYQ